MIDLDNLESLLRDNTPLIDTRSPLEFAKGSLPTAINLPLMTNDEREAVGYGHQTLKSQKKNPNLKNRVLPLYGGCGSGRHTRKRQFCDRQTLKKLCCGARRPPNPTHPQWPAV